MKKFGLALAAIGVATTAAVGADIESGLKPGERVSAFQVVDVSGPFKGQQLCYV